MVYYSFDTTITTELLNKVILRTEQVGGDVRLVTLDLGNKTLLSQLKVKMTKLLIHFHILIHLINSVVLFFSSPKDPFPFHIQTQRRQLRERLYLPCRMFLTV